MAIGGNPVIDVTERETDQNGAKRAPFSGGGIMAAGAVLAGLAVAFAVGFLLVAAFGGTISTVLRWVVPSALAVAALLGLLLVRLGMIERAGAARDAEIAARHPGQAWYADRHSDPQGTRAASEWGGDVGVVFLMLLVLVLAVPNFLWLGVFDPRQDPKVRLFALLVLVPDFFIYQIVTGLIAMAIRRVRFGRPYLGYGTFPFFLGESLSARVTARIFAGQEGILAILRCFEDRTVIHRGAGRRQSLIRTYQLYEVRRAFPGPFGGEDVPLEFDLPAEPSTDLHAFRPRYWELEIRGRASEGTVRFAVPVYARPGMNTSP